MDPVLVVLGVAALAFYLVAYGVIFALSPDETNRRIVVSTRVFFQKAGRSLVTALVLGYGLYGLRFGAAAGLIQGTVFLIGAVAAGIDARAVFEDLESEAWAPTAQALLGVIPIRRPLPGRWVDRIQLAIFLASGLSVIALVGSNHYAR